MNPLSNLLSKLLNSNPGQEDVKSSQEAKEDSKQASIEALNKYIHRNNFFHLTPDDDLKTIPVQFHSSEQIDANINQLRVGFTQEYKSHSEALFTNNVLKTLDIAKKYFSTRTFGYKKFYDHFYKTFIPTEEKNSPLTGQEKLTTLFLLKQGFSFRPESPIEAFKLFCKYIHDQSSHERFPSWDSKAKALLLPLEPSRIIIRETLDRFEQMHPHCHSLLINRDEAIRTILEYVIPRFPDISHQLEDNLLYTHIESNFYDTLVPELEKANKIKFTDIQKDTAFLLFKQTMVLMYPLGNP